MQRLAPAPRQDVRWRALSSLLTRPPEPPDHTEGRPEPRRHRAVFVSDVHLGTRSCKAHLLLEFLRHTECEHLYLVGDIVDGWALERDWFWPPSHDEVLREILRKLVAGTRITYVTGNHDEFLRKRSGIELAGVELVDEAIHETADGRKLLVLHGDGFDVAVRCSRWLVRMGDRAFGLVNLARRLLGRLRRLPGLRKWSLAAFLKRRVKGALSYVSRFEEAIIDSARARGVDGVVAGHVHEAGLRRVGEFQYANDGDWVGSCTALVEEYDGALRIVRWTEERAQVLRSAELEAAATTSAAA